MVGFDDGALELAHVTGLWEYTGIKRTIKRTTDFISISEASAVHSQFSHKDSRKPLEDREPESQLVGTHKLTVIAYHSDYCLFMSVETVHLGFLEEV